MPQTLKIHYQTYKKIALAKDLRSLDFLKTQIKNWDIIDSDEFDVFFITRIGDRKIIQLQSEWASVFELSELNNNIEIEIKKRGVSWKDWKEIDPKNDQPEESKIIVICQNEQEKNEKNPYQSEIKHIFNNGESFIEVLDDTGDDMKKKKGITDVIGFKIEEDEMEELKNFRKNKILPELDSKDNQIKSNNFNKNENGDFQVKELRDEIEKLRMKLEFEKNNSEEYRQFAKKIEAEKNLLERQKQSVKNPKEGVLRLGSVCKICGVSPIRGKLFMCLECDNFNICEDCDAKAVHEDHSMVRLSNKLTTLPKKETLLAILENKANKNPKNIESKEALGANKTTSYERIKFLQEVCGEEDRNKIESIIKKYSHMNDIQFQDAVLKDLGFN